MCHGSGETNICDAHLHKFLVSVLFSFDDEIHLGFPLLDTEVMVCDESGQTLPEGVGRIFIGKTFLD